VITTTQFVPNSNGKSVKRQTLRQIKPRKIQIAQHQFHSMTVSKKQRTSTHAGTINITITRLVPILLHFHAVSSRLLLNLWHSNNPEPKVHIFLLEIKDTFEPCLLPMIMPHFFDTFDSYNDCKFQAKPFKISAEEYVLGRLIMPASGEC